MKLYNRTTIPSEILEPILVAAGRNVGARTSGVIVKVTRGRTLRVAGTATRADWVHSWFLAGKSPAGPGPHRKVKTDYTYITMTVGRIRPGFGSCDDALWLAENVYEIAQHEWAHGKEHQRTRPGQLLHSARYNGRRPAWKDRPEEKRAMDIVDEAQAKISRGCLKKPADLLDDIALLFWEEGGAA